MKYGIIENLKYITKNAFAWEKKLVWMFLLNTIILSIGSLPLTILPKYITQNLVNGIDNVYYVIIISSLLLLMGFLCNILSIYLYNKCWPRINHIRMKFMIMVGEKTMSLPYEEMENPEILDLSEKTGRAWECLEDGIAGILGDMFNLVGQIISILLFGSILFSINWRIFIVILISCALKFLISKHFSRREDKLNDIINPINRRYNYWLGILFNKASFKDMYLFNCRSDINHKIAKIIKDKEQVKKKIYNSGIIASQLNCFTDLCLDTSVYIVLFFLFLNNKIDISDYVLGLSITASVTGILYAVLNIISHMYSQNIAVNTFRKYCEIPQLLLGDGIQNLVDDSLNIKFSHVYFKYPGNEKYALKDINFEIKSGEKVALVGINGAGKTTIVNLLLKFYNQYKGEIFINNINIKSIDSETLLKLFSAVFQNIYIYAYTLQENIEITNNDQKKLYDVLKKTDFFERVNMMPNRENSQMTKIFDNDGVELSGGEQQKLAIARALYKECRGVILDEPTAALDALSEYKIYNLVNEIFKKKTVLFISHRMMSTKFSDKIIVLSNGEIAEMGTHEELIASNGLYADMFFKQAYYYVQGDNSDDRK